MNNGDPRYLLLARQSVHETDRGMHRLRQVHEDLPLRAEYSGASAQKLRGLQEGSGGRDLSLGLTNTNGPGS